MLLQSIRLAVFLLASSLYAETRYLQFQLLTGPMAGMPRYAASKAQLDEFVHEIVKAIGTTGDSRNKLGFTPSIYFNMTDDETRQLIRDAFAVARENDVAVAFHLDDSIFWGDRKDLLADPDNIETADWEQTPNTGRRADWGPKPSKFAPQMCYNSPEIKAAVRKRAALAGGEIKKEVAALKDKGYLFAGVIAGWETQIGRDFETDRQLGYRALSHRGFNAQNPPQDPDMERVQIVKEFIELWADSLHEGGVASNKIFCHIAFTSQGLRAADAKESYAAKVHFALPEVAFSTKYRPGFSTYPESSTIKEIHAVVAAHGGGGWISAEGTNVSPTSMPGEANMETYLGKMFNHGAVMVNVFSWGFGGPAQRENFFRKATENPEALGAYAKFLHNEPLVESARTGFSAEALQSKMQRIQKQLPVWVERTGGQAKVMPLTEKIKAAVKERNFVEADKFADEILAIIEKP